MDFLKRLFGKFARTPPKKAEPDSSVHPLLAMKQVRDASKKRGVGVVYGADGRPRISPDWAAGLTLEQRAWVDKDLASRGYRIVDYTLGTVEEIV